MQLSHMAALAVAGGNPTREQIAQAFAEDVVADLKQIYGFAFDPMTIVSIIMAIVECLKKSPEELADAIVNAKNLKQRAKFTKKLKVQIRKGAKGVSHGPLSNEEVDAVADVIIARANTKAAAAFMAAPA